VYAPFSILDSISSGEMFSPLGPIMTSSFLPQMASLPFSSTLPM
jgi:hypothetical protein